MKKLKNSKGFTLMEMLIVVAIIAVLVAIAIPTFTNQLEKAREATDLANLRGAYAQVMAAALTNSAEDTSINLKREGNDGAASWFIEVPATQTVANWQTKDVKVADIAMNDDNCTTKGGKNWIVKYSEATGKASIALAQ
mgnify:FL=1